MNGLRLDLIYPVLPPETHGIGDHTMLLASGLADRGHSVRIITKQPAQETLSIGQAHGVEIVDGWPDGDLRDTKAVLRLIVDRSPDWVVLQFEQFTYGPRGFNPKLARLFAKLRAHAPAVGRVLFAHEAYVRRGRLGHTVMWLYQSLQFRMLVRAADMTVVTTKTWLEDRVFRSGRKSLVVPAYSNIAPTSVSSNHLREDLGIGRDQFLMVMFGGYNGARSSAHVREVLSRIEADDKYAFLYMGRDADRFIDDFGSHRSVRVLAQPSARTVSQVLKTADLAISPFARGVTSRNGSFMATLQHGVATVTTLGPETDSDLREAIERKVVMAADIHDVSGFADLALELANSEMRSDIAQAGGELYAGAFSIERALNILESELGRGNKDV